MASAAFKNFPPTSSDDICLPFCLILILWVKCTLHSTLCIMLCSHYVKSVPRGRIFGHLFLAKCSDSVYNPLNTVYSLPYKIYIVCCTVYTVLHYVVQQLSVCFILWKMSPAILYCINHRTVDWANVLHPVKHGSFRDMHVLEQKDEDCLKLKRFAGRDSIANIQIFEAFKFQRMRTGAL